MSLFDFADTAYAPNLSTIIANRVQRMQNSCLRLAFSVRKFDHITPAFETSGCLNMKERWTWHLILLTLKTLNSGQPNYLRDLLKYLGEIHQRQSLVTRSAGILMIPRHRKAKFQNSFSYLATTLFNSLPSYIKEIDVSNLSNHRTLSNAISNFIKSKRLIT